jgi:thymidylate synthase (FAD)
MHIIHSAIYGRGKRFHEIKRLGDNLLKQANTIIPEIFKIQEKVETGTDDKELRLKKVLAGIHKKSDKKKVVTELISHSHEPEEIAAISAIIKSIGCETNRAKKLIDEDEKLFNEVLQIVTKDRRKRELEQVNFTFRINRISLAALTHIVRHRMQSIIVPLFTEFGKSEDYIIPETISNTKIFLRKYKEVWEKNRAVYETFKEVGVIEEDLVYLYLSGNLLDIITTMNARELYHFLRLRTCNRAQWEIRIIAIDMLRKLRKASPRLFSRVGPGCFMAGKCPEGKLSCGKMDEIEKYFKGIENYAL